MISRVFVILLGFLVVSARIRTPGRNSNNEVSSESACDQPRAVGMCRAAFSRFFFDKANGRCTQFTYGGCGGNSNNFHSEDECRRACNPVSMPRCKQRPAQGHCNQYHVSYFFNSKTNDCRRFVYGGCGGNSNNFRTETECMRTCSSVTPVPVCKQPAKTGPCKARAIRYFFNSQTKRCETFVYGGCQANDNNFQTRGDCQKACSTLPSVTLPVCLQPKKTGPCRAAFPRFYFNSASGRCERFVYGGCQPNDNNFMSLGACRSACPSNKAPTPTVPVCQQPAKTGPCRARAIRYFFNSQTKQCGRFTYGGCQANDNNFLTLASCQRACPGPRTDPAPTPTVPVCQQPSKTGPCRARAIRYFFNSQTKQCGTFTYGGCQANDNNFLTHASCQRACPGPRTDPVVPTCQQPAKLGPCEAAIARFFFDSVTQQCRPFSWGGCQPNDNNFVTLRDCQRTCSAPVVPPVVVPLCQKPAYTGPCFASMVRYYYNPAARRCQTFTYGGCRSNGNNFMTLGHCQLICPARNY